jgi:hypothetical protein
LLWEKPIANKLTSPVKVLWKDRSTDCNAVVLPGEEDVLLGALALEGLDLVVNPVEQILEGAHGEQVLFKVK